MLFHGLKLFIRLCKSNLSFTILSVVCLFSSFLSLIFLFERGYYQYIVDVDTEAETQVLFLSSSNEEIIEDIYYSIIDNPIYPKLKNVTVSGNTYSGLYWNIDSETSPYYTPYGRFFNRAEVSTNAKVALLGTEYLSSFSPDVIDSIWDRGIIINGELFSAIGTYNYNWGDVSAIPPDAFFIDPLPNAVTIPINSFFDIGLKATRMRCVFSSPLTLEQRETLRDFLGTYSELQQLIFPKAEETNQMNMFAHLIKNTAPFAIIILLSILNISNIILFWLHIELVRFQVYRICGANSGTITFLISFQVLIIVLLGYSSACLVEFLLRQLSPYGVIAQMPSSLYLTILGTQFILMIILILIKSFRILSDNNLVNLYT